MLLTADPSSVSPRFLQFRNAFSPIVVRPLPKVIDLRFTSPSNAPLSIVVTLSGKITERSDNVPESAPDLMVVTGQPSYVLATVTFSILKL